MKSMRKLIALTLVGAMVAALAGCGGSTDAEEPASTDAAATTPAPTATAEPEVEATPAANFPWVETHASEDFTLSDLYAANSATNLVPAGSGKALKVNYVEYRMDTTDSGVVISEEPSYEGNFYQWFDEEGRLNWMRYMDYSENGVNNSWNVIDTKTGYGYSTVWNDTEGLISRRIYTNPAYQMASCDTIFPLYTLKNSATPFQYDPTLYVEEGDAYAEQMKASTWNLPMSDQDGAMFTAYLDDNMNVQLLAKETMWGTTQAAVPTIIDVAEVPATPDVESVTVMCDWSINGTEMQIPLLKDISTTIFTASDTEYAENEKITTDKPVTVLDEAGNSTGEASEIVNTSEVLMDFKITDPVKFTVTYEYPESADSAADSTAQ